MSSDVVEGPGRSAATPASAMLSVPARGVCLSSGVLSGGTATTVAGGVPGCWACAAVATQSAASSGAINLISEIITPVT